MDAPVHVPLLLQTQSTHTHSGYYRPEEREENSPRQLCAAILYPPAPFLGSERDVRKAKGEQEETAEGRGPPRPPPSITLIGRHFPAGCRTAFYHHVKQLTRKGEVIHFVTLYL